MAGDTEQRQWRCQHCCYTPGMSAPQFSLRRLLINVTVLCVSVSLIGMFPTEAIWLSLKIALHSLAILVIVVACYFSDNRSRTILFVGLGATLGWLLAPQLLVNWGRSPTFWERFVVEFITLGIAEGIGALLGAIIDIAITVYDSRANPKASRKATNGPHQPVEPPEGWK